MSLPALRTTTDKPKITLDLPEKGIHDTVVADLSKGSQVPIALENGQLRHTVLEKIGFA